MGVGGGGDMTSGNRTRVFHCCPALPFFGPNPGENVATFFSCLQKEVKAKEMGGWGGGWRKGGRGMNDRCVSLDVSFQRGKCSIP